MTSNKFIWKIKSLAKVTTCSTFLLGGILYYRNDEKFFQNFLMPLSRSVCSDSESLINLGVFLCKWNLVPRSTFEDPSSLSTTICGISIKNCVGCAAGFDRNGEALKGLDKLGFGFVEIGTLLPEEQENTHHEIFHLKEDEALIYRNGSNSKGHSFIVPKMRLLRRREEYKEILGFNIGKNTNSDLIKDVSLGVKVFSPVANYLVINVDSASDYKNSKVKENLRNLLIEVNRARLLFDVEKQRPIFLKLSPELSNDDLKCIVEITKEKNCKIHGFIVANSTLNRDFNLKSKHQTEEGGLSGKPLREKSTALIRDVYKLTNGTSTIIGVGGISSGEDAFEKILAGASAVQIYTSFIYNGSPVVTKIKRELHELLLKNGYENVSEAVGKGVELQRRRRFSWIPFLR